MVSSVTGGPGRAAAGARPDLPPVLSGLRLRYPRLPVFRTRSKPSGKGMIPEPLATLLGLHSGFNGLWSSCGL